MPVLPAAAAGVTTVTIQIHLLMRHATIQINLMRPRHATIQIKRVSGWPARGRAQQQAAMLPGTSLNSGMSH
jgi:hypothetical protein